MLRPLKGYDAVQLATGLILKETLIVHGITDFVFVSADNTLVSAAIAEGVVVENPNNYF